MGTHAAAAVVWVLVLCAYGAGGQLLRQFGAGPGAVAAAGAGAGAGAAGASGVCVGRPCGSLQRCRELYARCTVVLGALQLTLLEHTDPDDFTDISFPNLREVTEFVVVYRVTGLRSLAQLFPNLARIRGRRLLNDYALVVHDIASLEEIGLYGLTRIDRGGVVVWGVGDACHVDSVAWERVAPRGRLALPPPAPRCSARCTCSDHAAYNHCWNNRKCQIFLEGEEADVCHEQCLGCRKTRADECSLCRHYTHNGKCVPRCPSDTLVLPDSQYCVSRAECNTLGGRAWNGSCALHCPADYAERATPQGPTCYYCPGCDRKTCEEIDVWAVAHAQEAEGCVFVNGSLEIHMRAVQDAMAELTEYLGRIQEVSGYIYIYSSETITSLDFLPSLRKIKGQKLKHGRYSLVIHDMVNLQKLFTRKLSKNLKIERGTVQFYNNPELCRSEIDSIRPLFPVQPNNETDIPIGMNGYSGGCKDGVHLQIRVVDETTAVVMFSPQGEPAAHYAVLHARLAAGALRVRPETCSEAEWHVVHADLIFGHQFGVVELTSLRPASTYAICIETYDPVHKILTRSTISNFTTPVGRPEPPFIIELAAFDSAAVFVQWLDHKDYQPFISHYELDVSLLEIYDQDVTVIDQCKHFEYGKFDRNLHAVVMRPPPEYTMGCTLACAQAAAAADAGVEEHFDVCGSIGCDNLEDELPGNSTYRDYVKTMILKLNSPRSNFTIEGLAPFRDYRFRLRACAGVCSRSARGVVRTRASRTERCDVPELLHAAEEGGRLSVAWDPPNRTNGPILSFSVEIMQDAIDYLLERWCVLGNETNLTIGTKGQESKNLSVRVCARSMASDGACGAWRRVAVRGGGGSGGAAWGVGAAAALALGLASCGAGARWRRGGRAWRVDRHPILADSSSLAEDEPPSEMFTDFVTLYDIPLRDTQLHT